ncbi:MAG: arsenic transporter [Streptomycetaceae bacterium]|nr:arsenic transporter [Streptomycetaceae bacterium]
MPATIACVVLLFGVLGFAVLRPRGLPEAYAAVPAAALVVACGAVPVDAATHQIRELAPVVVFLAAILVLARLCDIYGLFAAAGEAIARNFGDNPRKLLIGVFAGASLSTAVLSLDATVVLATPVVLATAAHAGVSARPHVYATAHLANSASLPLPVSNLTNLLALSASGLSFSRFTALMVGPCLAAIAVEYLVLSRYFRKDLVAAVPAPAAPDGPRTPMPVFCVAVLVATLIGFAVSSTLGLDPLWAALAGAVVLAAPALARGRTTVRTLAAAASPLFCLFVLALGVLVEGVVRGGLDSALARAVPDGDSPAALLGCAALAALLANAINNLPATLVLLPAAAAAGPGCVLAVLIGVNIGPNLTYTGSLATLLWRRVLHERDTPASLADFTRLGLLTVPTGLTAATLALWGSLQFVGT